MSDVNCSLQFQPGCDAPRLQRPKTWRGEYGHSWRIQSHSKPRTHGRPEYVKVLLQWLKSDFFGNHADFQDCFLLMAAATLTMKEPTALGVAKGQPVLY